MVSQGSRYRSNRAKGLLSLMLIVAGLMAVMWLGRATDSLASSRITWIAQVPTTPGVTDNVRIWMNSDTVYGESAGVEYHIGSSYTKVLGTYDTSYSGANWRADIPAQAGGTQVSYQLFVRNQSGSDYLFTGFNWNYTVSSGNDDVHWAALLHDTFNTAYRSPFGAVTAGSHVTLGFRTEAGNVNYVTLRVYRAIHPTNPANTDYAMTKTSSSGGYDYWSVNLTTPTTPDMLYYRFKLDHIKLDHSTITDWYNDDYVDDNDNLNKGGTGVPSHSPEPSSGAFQLTVYDPAFTTPTWIQNAVIYQIFPDRFRNGNTANDSLALGQTYYGNIPSTLHSAWNQQPEDPRVTGFGGRDFFGGDLQGIQNELPYLKALGVTALYLNPIFQARSNHRYDTDNYNVIDPILGTETDFTNLTSAASGQGMQVILDGVFNHSSSDGTQFDRYHRLPTDGACESLTSTWRTWFLFFDNNVPCTSADYPNWSGFPSLPQYDKTSVPFRNYIYADATNSVVKHWYNDGAGGWRFDVADDPSFSAANWWQSFRTAAKSYKPNAPLIGEMWPNATRLLLGDQMDSVMNYRFRKNILGFARYPNNFTDNDYNGTNSLVALKPSQFDHAMRAIREDYPTPAQYAMMNLVDSHDTTRVLPILQFTGEPDTSLAKQRLKLVATFQFTYIGAPTVYYGDEIGLNAPDVVDSNGVLQDDPYNRAPYPWADTPGYYSPADTSLLAYYQRLSYVRSQHAALRTGDFATLLTDDTNNVYSFRRSGSGEQAVVVMNNDTASHTISVPVSSYMGNGTVVYDGLNNNASYTVSGGNISITLASKGCAILTTVRTP